MAINENPIERYYKDLDSKRNRPKPKWVVKPEWVPASLPESTKEQAFLELHSLPRLYQVLEEFRINLSRTNLIASAPPWIDPTLKSKHFDLRTEDPITLPVGGASTLLLAFTVPDRFAGNLVAFGHDIVDPTQVGNIEFTIQLSGVPIQFYTRFKQQIGQYNQPTPFPINIKLKYRQLVEVVARTTGLIPTDVFARLTGFTFPISDEEISKFDAI